ncbi:heterokaryon incompatibility protein-domain-containing protein [Dactylonectria estremocensis]|uniref:Heterokaryon incompatibility protein-domain-containing protein n=1 Tax=Dactylonectria estremocensis TaxID=1079267 RepID=A0A9P9ISL2_9HYPO|nr:heterokaryon incompatibility protein-domain-containing protein [Dactylonectria estremocensis]
MASALPLRLLSHNNGNFFVIDPRAHHITDYDIISYTWGKETTPYNCGIGGVTWDVTISKDKLEDVKRMMVAARIQYLWVDCVCINQRDDTEKMAEIPKMYDYYKSAGTCYILIDVVEEWIPQTIVDDLKFIDHVLYHMRGAALASEAVGLTENVISRLAKWSDREWKFDIQKQMVMSAAIDTGVLNCYSTCISHVRSLFDNLYFTRVWTFQEMILGKNIIMWGVNPANIFCLGQLHTWMDLATDSNDKALKLKNWIETSRVLKPASVNAILEVIEENILDLASLQTQVRGVNSARTDIINGGPHWWRENYKGISNIFSAVSLKPRECKHKADIFRGLLGVFSGLFTQQEIETELSGDDIKAISFSFFRKLSAETGIAWTKLGVSSGERDGGWNWIPVVENDNQIITTDCFSGVLSLGGLKKDGRAKAVAMTGLIGTPKKFMKIRLSQGNGDFQFTFKGCNCGKKLKTGMFSTERIPTYDQPRDVVKDETGRTLVHCATILGAIMDPGPGDLVEYRRRLLGKLQPRWETSDPIAKPVGWEDRSVSGTFWENPNVLGFRAHNMSMSYRMVDIKDCGSRLANGSTANILCHVSVNCGCTVIAPFALIFEAITAVQGSSLGDTTATLDADDRITLTDGLGLVQVGDVGKAFDLVAFAGDIQAHKLYSTSCRRKKMNESICHGVPLPSGRALVREEFTHDMTDMMKDYGYVDTDGCGNLLICRKHPMGPYKVVGVCIDQFIPSKKGEGLVTIR